MTGYRQTEHPTYVTTSQLLVQSLSIPAARLSLCYTMDAAFLRSTLGERFVIFGDPVVDGIPVHARREDSRFLVTWTGDVQNLRHFE